MEWLIGLIIFSIISSLFSGNKRSEKRDQNQQVFKKSPADSGDFGTPRKRSGFPYLEEVMKDWDRRLNGWTEEQIQKEKAEKLEQIRIEKRRREASISEAEFMRHREAYTPKQPATAQKNQAIAVGTRELAVSQKANSDSTFSEDSSVVELPTGRKIGGAVQGMMWAEIFGQPRSKNPHRTFYRG